MVTKDNKSTRRTKALIRDAMLELIREKPFQTITVTEIVERANIGRTTFYTHYQDVFALMEAIEDDVISMLTDQLRPLVGRPYVEGEHPIVTAMVGLYQKHEEIIALLSGKNGDSMFLSRLRTAIEEVSHQTLTRRHGYDAEKYLLYSSFVINGGLNLLACARDNQIPWGEEKLGFYLGELIFAAEQVFFPESEN